MLGHAAQVGQAAELSGDFHEAHPNDAASAQSDALRGVSPARRSRSKGPMTRGDFVARVLQLDGLQPPEEGEAVMVMAAETGLATEGQPERAITRAEAAAVLARFAKLDGETFAGRVCYFADVYPDDWRFEHSHLCRLYGIFTGTASNEFKPDDTVDAATAEVLFERALSRSLRSVDEQAKHINGEVLLKPAERSPLGVKPGLRGDDYPERFKAMPNDGVDEWNFYVKQCTSFVSWRLNSVNGVPFHNHMGGHWGNAKQWDDTARSTGFEVSKVPVVGAVAQDDTGTWGHVAWVAEVNGDTVKIEEYNYSPYKYGQRTASASSFKYLYVK